MGIVNEKPQLSPTRLWTYTNVHRQKFQKHHLRHLTSNCSAQCARSSYVPCDSPSLPPPGNRHTGLPSELSISSIQRTVHTGAVNSRGSRTRAESQVQWGLHLSGKSQCGLLGKMDEEDVHISLLKLKFWLSWVCCESSCSLRKKAWSRSLLCDVSIHKNGVNSSRSMQVGTARNFKEPPQGLQIHSQHGKQASKAVCGRPRN